MPKCSVCVHPDLAAIMREAAEGISLGDLAFRWSLSKASVHRHVTNHIPREKGEKRTNSLGNKAPRIKAASSSRTAEDGRCRECHGLLTEIAEDGKIDGKSLVWRAERLLHTAETIASSEGCRGCAFMLSFCGSSAKKPGYITSGERASPERCRYRDRPKVRKYLRTLADRKPPGRPNLP